MSALLVLLLAAVSLAGCESLGGYGPVQNYSGYVSAMAAPDGSRGVFTYHRLTYRSATGWRAFPDGGIPRYIDDESSVGVYDIESGEFCIALRYKNERWTDGQGTAYISQVTNGVAVLNRGGQLRDDLGRSEYEYLLLDLDTLKTTDLPLMEELEGMGLELGHFFLVDDAGTIIVIALPNGAADKLRDWTRDGSVAKGIWLRHPGGGYEKAADAIHYYGFTDGLVHYYCGDQRAYMVYDTKTGRGAPGGKYPPSSPDKTIDLRVSDGGNSLTVGRNGHGGWSYTDAGIDPDDLF